MRATWQKLDDGTWAVRIEAQQMALLTCLEGQEVEVIRRDGSKSVERVARLVALYKPRAAKTVGRREIKAIPLPVAVCLVVPKPKPPKRARPAPALVEAYERARLEVRRVIPAASAWHQHVSEARRARIDAEETEREYEQERLYG